jgi:predicted DNA-binding protein (MmcQ/YjbR family)
MNLQSLQSFCRALPGATEDIKWGDHLVFSVGQKMFASFYNDRGLPFAFKCSDDDFDRLTALRGIIPAPYAARFSWVSVREPTALSQSEAQSLLRASYDLVLAALPKRTRDSIAGAAAPPAGPSRMPRRAKTAPHKR